MNNRLIKKHLFFITNKNIYWEKASEERKIEIVKSYICRKCLQPNKQQDWSRLVYKNNLNNHIEILQAAIEAGAIC